MTNIEDTISERPWGNYFKLYQEMGVWVKRVEVKPGARLSLQQHRSRSEKWIIVRGSGMALIDDVEHPLKKGSVVDIPCESVHRISNTGDDKLVFIEVATGENLSEQDITRLQDDYARTPEQAE